MAPTHLTSDQRQYFWMSVVLAAAFAHLACKVDGGWLRLHALAITAAEAGCAIAIHRGACHARWFYLAGCGLLVAWVAQRMASSGYSHGLLVMGIGALLSTVGFYWLGRAMAGEETDADPGPAGFELPEQHCRQVDELVAAYTRAFGEPEAVHHIVPKSLWLHRYADFIITIPPTPARPTWLYGTLLLTALSGTPQELILERPEEDTLGAVDTLSRLTEFMLEHARLEEWHTMGSHAFFSEASAVRGLLFCPPPTALAKSLPLASGDVRLLYVTGITDGQLATAQAADDAHGGFAGSKALHAELRIAEDGITHLPR